MTPIEHACPGAALGHPQHALTAKRCLSPECGLAWVDCPGAWSRYFRDGCVGCGGRYWTEGGT